MFERGCISKDKYTTSYTSSTSCTCWEKLEDMVKDKVIVEQREPTDWVNALMIVEKRKQEDKAELIKKENLRLCIDPRALNVAIKTKGHIFHLTR